MFQRHLWWVLIAIVLILGLPATTEPAHALGTPQIVSINPGSPAAVGTTITIRATVQWDTDFRSMRICFRDESWCQEDATPDITKSFNTSGLSAGMYQIIAEVAAVNQGWDTANKTYANYQLTENQPAPQPTNPPSISCSVNSFDVSPRSVNVGDSIHIQGSGSCNVGVRAIRVLLDGGSDIYEIGSPSLSTDWSTSGNSLGQHKLVLQVAGQGDNNWSQASQSSPIYIQIGSPSQPAPAPSCAFNKSDVISINGTIFVMDGNCNRHWVPNPETLDALGIPRAWIDNKGLSNADLMALHQGSDVPDANRDPSGFQAFKNKYFPNTTPIGQGNPSPQQPPQQPPAGSGIIIPVPQGPTGFTDGCPNAKTMVKPGDVAIITDFSATDNSLNIRSNPDVNADIVSQIPIGGRFTIIAGPKCKDNIRWYEVGYNGFDGWSAEVSQDGQYNYVPNGYLPGGSNTTAGSTVSSSNVPQAPAAQPPAAEPPAQRPQNQDQNMESSNTLVPGLSDGYDPGSTWDDFLHSIGMLSYGSPNENDAQRLMLENQCTWFVAGKRPDVAQWIGGVPRHAYLWDSRAWAYGGKYGVYVTKTPAKGDVAVWGKGCANADSDYGHVAYVTNVDSKTGNFSVDEMNWKGVRPTGGIPVQACMSFITPAGSQNPYQPIKQPNSLIVQLGNLLKWLTGK